MEDTQDETGERAMVEVWRLLTPTARAQLFATAAAEAARVIAGPAGGAASPATVADAVGAAVQFRDVSRRAATQAALSAAED